MGLGNFLKKAVGVAAPVVGGVVGGPIGAAAGKAASSLVASGAQSDAANRAADTGMAGYNYFTSGAGSPLSNNIINTGGNALAMQAGVLGLPGGDPNAAAGLDNFYNSAGGNFLMRKGQDAITSNAAAAGQLESGATLKALEDYGQGLAGTFETNYFNQLGNLSGAGQQQLGTVGNAAAAGAPVAANAQLESGNAQAAGIIDAATNLGTAATNWFNRRKTPSLDPITVPDNVQRLPYYG